MEDKFNIVEAAEGKEKYYSEETFLSKLSKYGLKLGFKALHGAAVLYCAQKSKDLPKTTKLMIIGVLGYFILPTDIVADFLPVVGLADDTIVILKAVAHIYSSITDEMKEEAHQLLKEIFGNKYQSFIKQ